MSGRFERNGPRYASDRRTTSMTRDGIRLTAALAALAAITVIYVAWLQITNATTVAMTFMLVVLVAAATSRLLVAVITSVAAMLCFNFFFLPPVGTLTIADPQNWAALIAFLAVSLVASNLSSVARARAEEAMARRDEVARLFDLSRDVLLMTDSRDALSLLARFISRRFDLEYVAVCQRRGERWEIAEGGSVSIPVPTSQLALVLASAEEVLEFDARNRTYAGHRTITVSERAVRLVPLRVGTKPIGVLAAAGRPVDPGSLDALGGVAAIAIERAQFLEERKAAELAGQSEELKSALLASLGHDLRTPLTAIRVAASNLQASWLGEAERREQADVVLTEVERLTRLFEDILDMARLDAGAVSTEPQWVHPSQIVDAAREHVQHALSSHPVAAAGVTEATLVRLDPRLTAAALAHLLENAARYTPPGSPITVTTDVRDGDLIIAVRDRGPGIAAADLPRLFERFYRGAQARRVSGTGMGLSIARGLLAVERGRIWAENCSDGGAQFTISVPVERKRVDPVGVPADARA
jgi:two-component system, OmpR family, sensor histidine kinase KdpD